jgi:ATP-binding cassette subfamily F protein 3
LDIGSIDALIGALKQYHGTLIFISHDVHFIRAIATTVLQITADPPVAGVSAPGGSRLTFYPGDYEYYIEKSKSASARAGLTAGGRSQVRGSNSEAATDAPVGLKEQKAQKRKEAEARNAVAKARREKEAQLHALEMKIAALEGQQKQLVAALENPAAYEPGGHALAINRELAAVTDDLGRLTHEWESATAAASLSPARLGNR